MLLMIASYKEKTYYMWADPKPPIILYSIVLIKNIPTEY